MKKGNLRRNKERKKRERKKRERKKRKKGIKGEDSQFKEHVSYFTIFDSRSKKAFTFVVFNFNISKKST